MRIAFMGSPDFAVPALQALVVAGHDVVAVYCQPPRPAGRGQAVRKSPVQVAAEAMGLPVHTPVRLRRNADAHAAFAALDLDIAVVAAYGLILPEAMLVAPRRGCLNIHASLLPRWRGAAPIQAALLAGDRETGVTIMQMDAGLDTGAMLLRGTVPIGPATTATDLHNALAAIGAALMLQALDTPPTPIVQPEDGATYAAKLTRDDGRIDWHQDAALLDRQIRALNPWPGTFTRLDGVVLKILAASLASGTGAAGTAIGADLTIACGQGALLLARVQVPGRAAMSADAFLRGHAVPAGTVLGR